MPVLPVVVTITGSGASNYCYAIINGTKQYSAGMHEVNAGDTITFGVGGTVYGSLTIDGTEVTKVAGGLKTYDWTVPSGISTVEIAMAYNTGLQSGKITVTTA